MKIVLAVSAATVRKAQSPMKVLMLIIKKLKLSVATLTNV